MGIKIVGDRCRFRHVLKAMGRKARHIQRNKVGKEVYLKQYYIFESKM